MEFVRSLRGYDHLWAVKFPGQDTDELTRVFRNWSNFLEKGIYVVTGGAIKLTPTMQERPHTKAELDKMDKCREYLKSNGVFDQESFIDYLNEGKND